MTASPSCRVMRLATLAAVLGAAPAWAADLCSVMSRSEAVAVVLCAPAAVQDDWRRAGIDACKGKTSCNAWIWDDAAKTPTSAPKRDADLPKSQTAAARAIWVHPGENLIIVRKTK